MHRYIVRFLMVYDVELQFSASDVEEALDRASSEMLRLIRPFEALRLKPGAEAELSEWYAVSVKEVDPAGGEKTVWSIDE